MTAEGESYGTRMNNYTIKSNRMMFTQMQAQKGIENFGESAVAALFK